MTSSSEPKRLMMEIEIKFGKGRSDRVQVHYDDDAEKLALDFVQRHRLKESSTPVISKYITTTMENFLSQPRLPRRPKEPSVETSSESTSAPESAVPPPPPNTLSPASSSVRSRPSIENLTQTHSSTSTGTVLSTPPQQQSKHHHINTNLDGEDILSQISRSLSLSVENKHLHENSEKRLSGRTFSLKDIESELAAASATMGGNSSDIHTTSSLDSDTSTIAVLHPISNSLKDSLLPIPSIPPANTTTSGDRGGYRLSPTAGIGFDSNYSSRRPSSPSPPPPPPLQERSRERSSTIDPYHTYNNSSISNPTSGGYAVWDRTDLFHRYADSVEEYPSRDADIDDSRTTSTPSTNFIEDEEEEEEASINAEDMYNRLKNSVSIGKPNTINNQSYSHNNTTTNSSYENSYNSYYNDSNHIKTLKPSSKIMQLGLKKTSLHHISTTSTTTAMNNDNNFIGKTANERLHHTAFLDKMKREKRSKYAIEKELKDIENNKFKLNKNSKRIITNLQPKQQYMQYENIGERLYNDGIIDKKLKLKRCDELKDKLNPEEWSCSKCGTYQIIRNTTIVIQPLHQMANSAHIRNNTTSSTTTSSNSNTNTRAVMICNKCGWNQSAVPSHHPVNIALQLSENSQELLKNRFDGHESTSTSTSSLYEPSNNNNNNPTSTTSTTTTTTTNIHQYLYENARTRENIQQLNRVLWNEANSDLTFTPSIPEASIEILEKYKSSHKPTTTATSADNNNMDFKENNKISEAQLPTTSSSHSASAKNILAGPVLSEYLNKSATERLSKTQTRPVIATALKQSSNNPTTSNNSTNNIIDTESNSSTIKPYKQEEFVNRLVYEYEDKRARLKKQEEYSIKHDITTGLELFKPKIGPNPEESLGFGHTTTSTSTNPPNKKRNVFEDIIEKDKILKLKRKNAQDIAIKELMNNIHSKQIKALESSQMILLKSTNNNIEELFQVLLESQKEIIQNNISLQKTENPNFPNPEDGVDVEWKNYLLDLDQINSDLLIPEVSELLNEVRGYKLNQLYVQNIQQHQGITQQQQHSSLLQEDDEEENNNTTNNNTGCSTNTSSSNNVPLEKYSSNMLVSFDTFKKLILRCMKKRDGCGKSYVYIPKKKSNLTIEMIEKNLREETFHPKIDKNSILLSLKRQEITSDYPIENLLHIEGERIRNKWEHARQERIVETSKELTFKPKLYKTPSYIKPKYWGMENNIIQEEEEEDSDNQTEGGGFRDSGNMEDSSIVSSDDDQQVLQMPALQPRPTHHYSTTKQLEEDTELYPSEQHKEQEQQVSSDEQSPLYNPPLPENYYQQQTLSTSASPTSNSAGFFPPPLPSSFTSNHLHHQQHQQDQHQHSPEHMLYARPPRHRSPPHNAPISPVSHASDEHSINTISTISAPPSHSNMGQDDNRSVISAAPLVTRRRPSSIQRRNSSNNNTANMQNTSTSSSNNIRSRVGIQQSGSSKGRSTTSTVHKAKTPTAAGLPPLPFEMASSSTATK